jgi:hypothetical protein
LEGINGVAKRKRKTYGHLRAFCRKPLQHIIRRRAYIEQFRTEDRVTTTEFTKFELRDHLSLVYASESTSTQVKKEQSEIPTSRKNPHEPINSHTHHPLSPHLRFTLHDLDTNINSRVLCKPNNLRPPTPVPAYERFMSACAHEVATAQIPLRCPASC